MPTNSRPHVHRIPSLVSLALPLALGACADESLSPALTPDPNIKAAWVEIGDNNRAIARVTTTDAACPSIGVDGKTSAMSLRAAAGSTPALSEDDIDALVAFLKTLTDARYATSVEAALPPAPSATSPAARCPPAPARCRRPSRT